MDKKAKIIIIGLVVFVIIFIVLCLQISSSKQTVVRERDDLIQKNTELNTKIDSLNANLRQGQKQVEDLNRQLDKISQLKDDFERRYTQANRDKQDLMDKLKAQQADMASSSKPTAQEVVPLNADAYWARILKAKTDLEMQLSSMRSDLKTAQINNEQLQREKSTLELDMKRITQDKEDLKRQFDYNQKLMDSIAQELVREKDDKIKIQAAFKTTKGENLVLTRQLKSLNGRKINLERKYQELLEQKEVVAHRLSEMETMLTQKAADISGLKDQIDNIRTGTAAATANEDSVEGAVELPPVVVRPQQDTLDEEDTSSDQGKILAVNTDSNFVIINLGSDSGVKLGDSFQVYREAKIIASVEAIQVRRSISACDIKKAASPIRIGDVINSR